MKNLVKGLLAELSKVSKSDSVVGGVRDAGKAKVVPLSRISLGFGVGLGGAGGKASGDQGDGKAEAGGAGGAVVVEPRAFVVVGEDGLVHMLALKKGKAAVVRRGIEILPDHHEHMRLGEASERALPAAEASGDPKNQGGSGE